MYFTGAFLSYCKVSPRTEEIPLKREQGRGGKNQGGLPFYSQGKRLLSIYLVLVFGLGQAVYTVQCSVLYRGLQVNFLQAQR